MAPRSLLIDTDTDNADPSAPRLVTAVIALTDRQITVTGQTTPVPGLAVTPSVAGDPLRFTGGWRLTHAPSQDGWREHGEHWQCPACVTAHFTGRGTSC